MLFVPLVLFTQVTYCIVDGDIDDVVPLSSSHYCFVNESTIRINDSDVNIINNTGD